MILVLMGHILITKNYYGARTVSGITAIIVEDLVTEHLHQKMGFATTQRGKKNE